jgi:predicted GNAT superfamily acetyltransferase
MCADIRQIRPVDYGPVISIIDDWWNGRDMASMLPRLFFEHFTDTSFAAERNGELTGFLVGFVSQSHPAEAYIHFAGVRPDERGRGLGRRLYLHFFAAVEAHGRDVVRAVTAPVNHASVRFHQHMGFDVEPGDREVDGLPVTSGYDGIGNDRVCFVKHLTTTAQVPGRTADLRR